MNLIWCVETSGLGVFSFVDVGDGPFLAELISELTDSNIGTFFIFTVDDLNDSAGILSVLEVILRIFELLEPFAIGSP